MAKKDLQLVIKAKDEASKTINGVQSSLSGFAKKLTSLPALLGIGLSTAALTAFAKKSLDLYNVQAKAEANLERALANTQGQVGRTTDQLKAYASQLQGVTTFGDEAIINVQAIQAAFSNIQGDMFDRVTKSALDLSAALGKDLESSARHLAKSINEPEKGMASLAEAGITFTKQQQEQVKALVASGQTLAAQEILLGKVESAYAGAAEALANTTEGKLTQLQNRFGDFQEQVGAKLAPIVDIAVTVGGKVLTWLEGGFAKASTMAASFFSYMQGHITARFTSIYEIIRTIFTAIWAFVSSTWERISNLMGGSSTSFIDSAVNAFKYLQDTTTIAFAVIEATIKNFGAVLSLAADAAMYGVVKLGNEIQHTFTEVIPGYLTWLQNNWKEVLADLINYSSTIFTNLTSNIVKVFSSIPDLISGNLSFSDLWTPLEKGFVSTLSELPNIAERQIGLLEQTLKSNMDSAAANLGDSYRDIINQRLAQANAAIADTEKKAQKLFNLPKLPTAGSDDKAEASKVKSLADTIKDALAPAVQVMGQSLLGVQQSGGAKDDPIYKEALTGNKLAKQQLSVLEKISSGITKTGPQIVIEPLGLKFA